MITSIDIHSVKLLSINQFFDYLAVPQIHFDFQSHLSGTSYWYFHCKDQSTTLFSLSYQQDTSIYTISMDHLASYQDYRLFPYLVDTLRQYLGGRILTEGVGSIFQTFDEEWIEETIADEIAQIKGTLSLVSRYYIAQPLDDMSYITLDSLYPFGVNLHSSTPRIYGYLQYLMRHHLLPTDEEAFGSETVYEDDESEKEDIEVDVPQHSPIGKVKSWQLDGSETYETYSQEDVDHLMVLSKAYQEGNQIAGVVLNDIGTLHQEGIGMEIDGEEAAYWFNQAYLAGDNLYAPTNLGDLYRKGCGKVTPQLAKAFEAYLLSIDPYAHYRIGQAYEEGWCGEINLEEALLWYRRSAEEGHHLAIRRMKTFHEQYPNIK